MQTERPSPRFTDIDLWEPSDVLEAMIGGQFAAVAAVRAALPSIERASLVKIAWQKGSGDDCARKRVEGSHAPAKARQAMILSSCPSRSACFKQSPVALNNDVRLS